MSQQSSSSKQIPAFDATEAKRTGSDVPDSERRLATLLANLPGMAYRCRNDSHWTMEFVSEGCFRLTGYHPWELMGQSYDRLQRNHTPRGPFGGPGVSPIGH